MSVIATVAVPATAFRLGSLLDWDADATVSVETTVPTSEHIVPYLWVPADAVDDVVDTLEADRTVASASIVDEIDDSALVKVEWTGAVNGLLEAIRRNEAIVTSAVGTPSRWTFRLRFPSDEDLSAFYADCADRDIRVELVELHQAVSADRDRRFGLTNAQRELVLAAYDAGYFDVPRRTTLVELGDRLDISDSAVSQRLRRGLAALIGSTLVTDSPTVAKQSSSEADSPPSER
ncbi:helix-turn-helix domain-containing protein [Halopiger goleimassiliensis]|uniref:helix-turn-helix domain-containing protein n=1 Tax=Halopiger goleimassiliensis TaxID=1293048 RepID=UPI0006781C27|nr:bacterio-opsin activator domain-containing protein [Halopiger goleimassiliensis]